MSELKTLKDFYTVNNSFTLLELKAEAVKWLDKPRTVRMNGNDFILVFFNITEEDLI